jgi:hypothetical protein
MSIWAQEAGLRVVVEAGRWDRLGTPVELGRAPGDTNGGGWELVSEGESPTTRLAVQWDGQGRWWFLLDGLKRGTSRTYRVERTSGLAVEAVRAVASPTEVRLESGGRPVMNYRTVPTAFPPDRPDLTPEFRRGGYIHPVRTPSGLEVTDDYPSNHRHHHGIWFAWTSVVFEGRRTDMWNMGDKKGTVEFVGLDATWSGPVMAGFRSRHRQVDLTSGSARVALEEEWGVRLYRMGTLGDRPVFLFDLEVTDRCARTESVRLPKYLYGGLGVRGNWGWNDPARMRFLNSEGVTDRSKGDNGRTVGRWAYMGGALGMGWAGMAILGHSANAQAPQPQRIHPKEPFLSLAPQQVADLEVTPEKPLTSRYRFVVFDGEPDAAAIERLWNDLEEPPTVRFERVGG